MAASSPRSPRSREQRTWASAYAFALLLPVLLMLVSPYTEQAWTVFAVAVGFTAFAGMALQVVLVSRSPLVASAVGLDVLVRLHRSMGVVLVLMVLLHVAVIFVVSPWARSWLWPIHQPLVAQAGAAAFYAMILLGGTSVWRARFGMGYETWRLLHVALTAVAVLGGYIHVLYASDFSWSGPLRMLATLLLLAATASLVYLRVGRAFGTLDSPWLVADVRDEHGGSVTLTLDATRRGVDVRPGQFAWLRFAGRPYSLVEHPFSIASAAGPDRRRISFTIRSLGTTSHAVRELRPGATVLLDGPHGGVADELLVRPWILVVGGIGITPAMGILRSLAEAGDRRPVQLVYCVRDWEQATFRDELVELGTQLDLDLVVVATRPAPSWTGVRGRLDGRTLARVLPQDRASRSVLVCGPDGFATDVLGWLEAIGVPLAHVYAERFTSA
jgi:predicted ferric reductase